MIILDFFRENIIGNIKEAYFDNYCCEAQVVSWTRKELEESDV